MLHALVQIPFVLLAPVPAATPVEFNRDVRPILSNNCFFCHGPDKNERKKDLRLDVREIAISKKAVVPSNPEASRLVERIFSSDPDELMPPPESHKSLKPAEKEILRRWIAEGAVYQPHWAYIVPKRPAVPGPEFTIGGKQVVTRHPIDALITHRLAREGVAPSPEADPAIFIRRLHLDLVGLPPTEAETNAFLNDCREGIAPVAVERAIERLLRSPHFGERMAVPWLDLVRFSDTVGYHGDQNQRIFPYRDYVIDAFNRNLPFDQFTVEQLAGDLLPNPTTSQLVATGFNRLNMMTREGGAQPKEYLAKYAADRIRTLGVAWLGSTLGCCECHDHKFDPLTSKDFYSLQAFFADVREWGVYQDYGYTPNPDLRGWSNEHPFPPEIEVESPYLKRRIEKLAAQIARLGQPAEATWQPVDAEKSPDGFRAVVRGPVEFSALRLMLPRGGFTVKVQAIAGDQPAPAPAKTTATAAPKSRRARVAYRPGPGELTFAAGYANRRAPRYSNGVDILSVLDQWKSDPAAAGEPHVAVYYPARPVALAEGESLTIVVTSKDAREVSVAVAPATPLAPDLDSAVDLADGRWEEFLRLRGELAECRRGRAWTQVTVSQAPRPVRLLPRGNWMDESGAVLSPNVPAVLRTTAAEAPSESRSLNRLDLARWLSSPENPLTARVVMNRLWAQFFGTGLSSRLDDLGAQGEPPSHPELLDWLAVEFRESGWDMKHMVRVIATSDAYRRASTARPDLAEVDPNNRLLARQNARRLEAEFVRDNALAIAGLLDREVGGPSAFPPQPAGYYENLNFPQRDYPAQTDERRLRRGLYMHWQRTFLHPMLANFDAPSREECWAERAVSNTPQQALTLLNDPVFTEAAVVFAREMLHALPNAALAERIDFFFRRALARPPSDPERRSLTAFAAAQLATAAGDEAAARAVAGNSTIPPPAAITPVVAAAWTQVARVILNLHESITRD